MRTVDRVRPPRGSARGPAAAATPRHTPRPASYGLPVSADDARVRGGVTVAAGTVVRLVGSCVVLGVGVSLLLLAALGSDGYSTLVSGLTLALGVPFWVVNLAVGVALITLAWLRGLWPGLGTVVQPVVVGAVVSLLLAVVEQPEAWWLRAGCFVVSLPVLATGVAGYLATATGAGPAEAAAIALEPQVPFRWSYGVVQGGGALLGWLCGGAVGPGTVVTVLALGPLVTWLRSEERRVGKECLL